MLLGMLNIAFRGYQTKVSKETQGKDPSEEEGSIKKRGYAADRFLFCVFMQHTGEIRQITLRARKIVKLIGNWNR